MVETLVWNNRTGHLVSGHQRLSILDEEAEGDYSLDVAVVDLPLDREKELNVRLNNPSLMGSYDFSALESLIKDDPTIDAKAFGFDDLDLQAIMPEMNVESFGGIFDAGKDRAKPEIDATRRAKQAAAARNARASDSAEFYVVFVASTREDVGRILDTLGLDSSERFHDARRLADYIGLDLDKG